MNFALWLELIKALAQPMGGLITALSVIALNNYLAKAQKAKGTMDYTMDKGAEIYKFIYDLQRRYDALRVTVFLLHNGGTYFNGDHKKKVTMQYEAPRLGVDEISDDFQDYLIKGALFRWMDGMRQSKHGALYYDNRAQIDDVDIKGLLGSYDVQGCYSILLRDREGDAIGVLDIAFDRTDPLTSTERDSIFSHSGKLRSLLINKSVNSNKRGGAQS